MLRWQREGVYQRVEGLMERGRARGRISLKRVLVDSPPLQL